MKYVVSETKFHGFRVRLMAPEQEQQDFGYLVENMLGENVSTGSKYPIPRVHDTPAGIVVRFETNKEFQKFLVWREIFNRRDLNKTFSFIPSARAAIASVRKDMEANIIQNYCGLGRWL